MLLEILVQVHIVAGKQEHPGNSIYADKLRCVGMPAAGIASDARQDLLRVAVDESHFPLHVQFDQRQHILGIDAAVRITRLPGFSRVILQLIFLDPDPNKSAPSAWSQCKCVTMTSVM